MGRGRPSPPAAGDLRERILRGVADRVAVGVVVSEDEGIIAGATRAADRARESGLTLEAIVDEGTRVKAGDEIIRFRGAAGRVVAAEDHLIGLMAKPSGIATAARRFVERAGGRPRIVSGAWKKMPPSLKESVRSAVVTGGAFPRMSPGPFVYLDKNHVRILGGIRASLEAVADLGGHEKVVQIKGRSGDIVREAIEAVEGGADIVHVDTGDPDDARRVGRTLADAGARQRVRLAFSGNVKLEDLDLLKTLDIDILDVGRQIVDAPLLDMRMEVRLAGAARVPG